MKVPRLGSGKIASHECGGHSLILRDSLCQWSILRFNAVSTDRTAMDASRLKQENRSSQLNCSVAVPGSMGHKTLYQDYRSCWFDI
jgi:hypothetical protein